MRQFSQLFYVLLFCILFNSCKTPHKNGNDSSTQSYRTSAYLENEEKEINEEIATYENWFKNIKDYYGPKLKDFLDVSQVVRKYEFYKKHFFGFGDQILFEKFKASRRYFKDSSLSSDKISPFFSDGCSAFPDGTIEVNNLWKDCCMVHDIAYWVGGSSKKRKSADDNLSQCITESVEKQNVDAEKKDYVLTYALPVLVWSGVRVGGMPYQFTPWRWGYGWRHSIGYKELSTSQLESVKYEMLTYRKKMKNNKFDEPFGIPRNPEKFQKNFESYFQFLESSK